MTFKAKPLRSVLFVPGNKEDWMRKAPKYGADALILDLEDSVPLQEKAEARTLVGKMLKELGTAGQTLFVRVNELSTGMTADDIEAIACDELYGVILPKVTGPADVVETDILLKLFESRAGSQVGKTFIDPSLETAQGLRQAYEVAMASPRVAHMGASGGRGGDTARALGYQWTPEGMETLFVRSKTLLDSRAAGVSYPITGGWFDIQDLDGLRAHAQRAKDIGYVGMHLIHPYHVPVVNEVFTPSADELAEWQGLVQAMEEQRAQGGAAVTYKGNMVDIAHEQTARAMLDMARELGLVS